MGLTDSARMDVAAVLDIAHRFDNAADQVDGAWQRCQGALAFTGARAGREYTDAGAQVRRSVEHAIGALRGWSRSSREIASQLRVSAEDYAQIDDRAARRIG
ncbi:ESX-1 secretion-associated protein [Mycobacterium frederiksbergense]|uniref:type VII secretion target n=1 Tax=Mycolicibacterium frederiksbergense TaxID=117567 RepID=UPI0021F38275|nr:type VII secretion target [Mycolicibacterium frederiksbergense]MCV7045040.1 ESX-1 secretion-associated protein [Mycolicibacterium frederiksbergense]